MSFKDQLADDMANVFLNSDECAEEVTYKPGGTGGVTIKAIVDRGQLQPDTETGRTFGQDIRISIARHETLGVMEVAKNSDKVSLHLVIGGSAVDMIVADIISQDEGMWQLLLQK